MNAPNLDDRQFSLENMGAAVRSEAWRIEDFQKRSLPVAGLPPCDDRMFEATCLYNAADLIDWLHKHRRDRDVGAVLTRIWTDCFEPFRKRPA